MAEFGTAYLAPYPFALGQRSPFTDDPAEVKRALSGGQRCYTGSRGGSQTHQVSRDSSGDQRVRAIHQGTTDKQHHCCRLDKKWKMWVAWKTLNCNNRRHCSLRFSKGLILSWLPWSHHGNGSEGKARYIPIPLQRLLCDVNSQI